MSTTTPKVTLRLSFGNVTRLALSIPLDKCGTFAINPLKWLRFLGFAIYGREGYLSTSEGSPEIDNYTAGIEARLYYFVSEGEPRLADVDAVDDRTSVSSDLSTRRSAFRANVIERDQTCVLTGNPARQCIAYHIIPHAKGSNYMMNLVRHRGEGYNSANDIDDIDDTRNGLLLHNAFYFSFGAGELAFLKTPNFALNVDDIPYGPRRVANEASPDSRLTLHYFVDLLLLGDIITTVTPCNTDAQQPQDTSKWPPAIILDLFYAVAAINAWSPRSFIEYVRKQSKDAYYNGDDEDSDNVSDSSGPSHVDAQTGDQTIGSKRYALRSRNKMPNVRPKERQFADLMGGVYALWTQSSRVDKPKPEDDDHASSLTRNESVKRWLRSIEDPMTN
ncbi:hypothetical protein AX15_004609 [Amanita polypyramis BW_CC]|nr:hypothetical protein AX15_004609 [Amanita polypyramis BW_CC]